MGKALLILLAVAGTAIASPEIVFVGNESVPSQTLRREMSVGSFDEQLLNIKDYYFERGYIAVELGDPVIERDRVTIPIAEGERYSMGVVTLGGTPIGTAKEHLALLKVRPGDIFSRERIVQGTHALTRLYASRGYANALIIPLTKLDFDNHTVALTYEITPRQRTLPQSP